MKLEKYSEKSKGITLMVLVVTIIILLILAGVTIVGITGDNGILKKAKNAGEETKIATAKEQIQVAIISSYDSQGKFKAEDFISEIEGQGGEILSEENPIIMEIIK